MTRNLDFAVGVSLEILQQGRPILGRIGEEWVFLLRTASSIDAFGASCSHLGGPLQDGLIDGTQVVCPWHHACFDLRTGRALSAPAFNPLDRYRVEVSNGSVVVGKQPSPNQEPVSVSSDRRGVGPALVIIGGRAAGFAAAHTLRQKGWEGRIAMVSADRDPPYDRTLLTKDYLDGHFGDDRLEIAKACLPRLGLKLELDTRVDTIDLERRERGAQKIQPQVAAGNGLRAKHT